MAILREKTIPLADYPTGVHDIGWKHVPTSTTSIYIEIKRCTDDDLTIWPNEETQIKYSQLVSFDRGKTWIEAGGFESYGGIFLKLDGSQNTISTFIVAIPPEVEGDGRRIKQVVEIVNGPLRTEGYMELRD